MIDQLIQLWQAAVHVANLPYTLLLSLVVLYWIMVMVGGIDTDALDLHFTEADVGLDGVHAGAAFDGFLEYFNFKKVPVSVIVSFFALSCWVVGMLANHWIHRTSSSLLGLVVLVPTVVAGAFLAKFLTRPLIPLFKETRKHTAEHEDLIGRRVRVISSKADGSFGRVELEGDGAPITLSVRTEGETLPKGVEAVILYLDEKQQVYVITQLEV